MSERHTPRRGGRSGWWRRTAAGALTAALALACLSAGAATAAVPSWYQDASTGLFVVWGSTTGVPLSTACDNDPTTPPFETGADFQTAAVNAGWTPDEWVDAAQQIDASYIVYTTFHSQQGYLKTWPSSIPGSPATTHDYLGDLITAAHAASIKVLVYITPDPSHEGDGGCDWLDPAAYQTYLSDPSVDLETPAGWGRYSYDVVDELLSTHSSIDGFWFDGWNGAWTGLGMNTLIRSTLPGAVIVANDFGTSPSFGEDSMAIESYLKVMDPPYDHAGASWLPADADAEYTTAPLDWMYYGHDYTTDARQVIRTYATVAGAGWNFNLGLPTKLDGTFPPGTVALLDDLEDHLAWAGPAYGDSRSGGYDSGLQPGRWSDRSRGVVTADGTTQYLHVLERPQGAVDQRSGSNWVSAGALSPHELSPRAVSVDTAGAVWVVDDAGAIWRKSGGTWSQQPGTAQDLATGADGSVWIIGPPSGSANGFVFEWNGSGWTQYPGGARHIAVDDTGAPWVVTSTGGIYRWTGSAFSGVTGSAQDIAASASGDVWIIGPPSGSDNGWLMEWTGSGWSQKAGGGIRLMVEPSGKPWLVNTFGQVWNYDGSFHWISNGYRDLAAGQDGSIYAFREAPTSISLPDSGYTITAAEDLHSGDPLTVAQSGGVLTLSGIVWDESLGEQIFEISASGSARQISRSSLTTNASSSAAGHPSSAAVDGSYTTYWSPTGSLPANLLVALPSTQTVQGVRVTQFDQSPTTTGGYAAPAPERIRSAEISVSLDGITFTTVWTGELLNQRGAQVIAIPPTSARYVVLRSTSNWGGGNTIKVSSMDVITP